MPKKALAADNSAVQELLSRNVEEIIDRKHLEEALRSGKKLRIKFGIDPTGKEIHIGRAIVLWKLREFQDLGHQIVLILGDYTALIGDPSDKLSKRPMLTPAEVKKNLKTYLAQMGKILDLGKTEVRYNSEWLGDLQLLDVLKLTDLFTVSQMIERRNFKERFDKEEEISLREFMYPMMQGYDSVAVKADLELGGTDQLFNLMAGRKIQEHYGQKPQDILMTAMLFGLDGRKMSTSWGNVVNINDDPEEQFGKIMSMKDEMIIPYFYAVTALGAETIGEYEKALAQGENPKIIKEKLAAAVAARYHGTEAAGKAASNFQQIFSSGILESADIPKLEIKENVTLLDLLMHTGVPSSKSDARRLIEQGAIALDDRIKGDPQEVIKIKNGAVLKVGKRHYFRLAS